MTVIPYLTFQGTCQAAMAFYADVFGTKIDMMMRASETPDFAPPPGKEDHVAHCSMNVAGGEIYASDSFTDTAPPMAACSVMVTLPSNVASRDAFAKLAEGGTIEMPFQPTFWSGGFGTLTDKFGTKWMISSEEEPSQG